MKALLLCMLLFGTITFAQNNNLIPAPKDTVVIDTTNNQRMLLGYCSRQAFQDTSFSWWYNSLYDMYEIDSSTAASCKNKLDSIKITVVMGTWCSDSRRVVPKFLRILDYLKFPDDKVSIIAVGRDKKGRANETEGLKIKVVPTIIFYKNDVEIGRILEFPKESLEKDMLKILNG
jgi:hypothetical protein